jgi:hypothetical protein
VKKIFSKSYQESGKTQGGKMFWAGAFGQKNAVQQSTKLALDEILRQLITDLNTLSDEPNATSKMSITNGTFSVKTKTRMSMKKQFLYLIAMTATVSACSIKQTVEQAEISKETELCIIENPAVREGFLQTLQSSLTKKNINHRVVSNRSIPKECEWTMRYVGRWNWDMALYMSYAEIQVFHNGNLDGEAIYDSTRGGANLGKFIDAEPKIEELVNELLKFDTTSLFSFSFS